ncbi:site-2 protease family protein [Curtanaerobium respiraculi]|uniref:site-2 protease family protein n=1 Tax=Curtanaerobium respiraculi TaxID=2949669 RepID=UPI0024B367BD|nr:site-2 protease family protein [Curtanaerobium respiraculi]
MTTQTIAYYLCIIFAFVPAIVLHEVSHGFAAYKLGDPTAKDAGRLTVNPLAHVDPFGTIVLPLLLMMAHAPVFGYAKPVPYNPRYFKDKRKGDLIVGLAGPAANLVMALVGAGLAHALYPLAAQGFSNDAFAYFYLLFLPYFTLINLYLMFFNLLPIPPLDGSSIFAFLLPERHLPGYYRIQRYAMPMLLVLLFVVPYIFPVDPISLYMNFFAGNLANLLFPFKIS